VKRALISDIHGNLEALEAVLDHIRSQGIEEVYCLGDIVGYGPDPCKCLDAVIERCRVAILGNHDQAVLIDPDGFNPVALRAVHWTRERLAQERCTAQGGSAVEVSGAIASYSYRRETAVRSRFSARHNQRVCVSRRRVQPAENERTLRTF